VPPVASTGKKKRKLLDVRTMLLVAAGDQNADPAAAGALLVQHEESCGDTPFAEGAMLVLGA